MKALPTFSKLLLLLSGLSAIAKADDCTKFVDELSTFCRYNKNTGVNQLRKIRFLTDKKTLKKNCDIFKDIPNTDIEECDEEEEENKNIKMLDFFSNKQDDYNIFNIVSHSKDGSVCEDCVKWVLNKDTIDIFPEKSTIKKPFSSFLEMEIQTFENLEKKSFLLINFAYSNEKVGNGLRILVNGATKLDLTKSVVSSKKTIGYKLKLKPNKSYKVQIEYVYDENKEDLRLSERQMIDDEDDESPSDKSFAQIKLLYLKRGDFLKYTGNIKGEPDDDEDDDDDDEKPTEEADNGNDDNNQKDDDGNNESKPSEEITNEDKTFIDGGDNNNDTTDTTGDIDDTTGDVDDTIGDIDDTNGDIDNTIGDIDNTIGDIDNTIGDVNNGVDNNNDIDDTFNPGDNTNIGNNDNNTDGNDTTNNNNEVDNGNNNINDNVEAEKLKESSGYGNKVLIIGGIGLVASIFYCKSSASSKAKRQYVVAEDNLELDDLEKGIADIDRELDSDDDDMNHTNEGPRELDADEEAFFEEMSDDDEGYETYGFSKF